MQWGVLDELGGLSDVLRNAGGLQAAAGVERTVRISRKIKFKFQAGLVRSSEWVLLCVCVYLSAHRRLALPRELGQQGVLGSYTVTGAHSTAPFRQSVRRKHSPR